MSAATFLGSSRRLSLSRPIGRFLSNGRWLVAVLLLAMAGAAQAMDTFTVNTLADDANGVAGNCPANVILAGTCTLRDAIAATTADSNASLIQFSVSGTIVLSSTLVVQIPGGINGPALTISDQSGTGPITISGNNATTVFGLYPGTVTFAYITIANGNGGGGSGAAGDAGGIYNEANLTLNNVVLINNTTAGTVGGGGIHNTGTLTVNYSSFYNNSETFTNSPGGAIENNGGTVTVSDSTFSGNTSYQGGAIENDSTNALTVINTTFANNAVTYAASGIYNNGPALYVYNSTFWGNNKDGIAYDGSSLNIYNSLFDSNSECASYGPACPSTGDGHGNVVGPTNSVAGRPAVLPFGNYGGPTQTFLPMPGSSAICAGIYGDVAVGVTTDQRTFPLTSTCVDAGAVQSNYITVTSGADDATGTPANCPGAACLLRDAVAAANTAGDGDIDFASGVSTVTLTSAGPSTSVNANIVGPGANSLTVTGQGTNALFSTSGGSAFLYGMTFANGNNSTSGTGGAIYNQANLTVSGMAFTGNSASTAGGAIYNEGGTLMVLNSSFVNNTAPNGSALYNGTTNGAITAEYSTFANNTASSAGGIYSAAGAPLSIYNSTFTGNTGGGIDFGGASGLTIENSLLGESTECSVSGGAACPTTGTLGNVVTPTNVTSGMPAFSAPGSYSGTNTLYSAQSVLPEPGSSAICAGSSTLIPAGITTDQRGFSNENITYTGYSASNICVDAGAVQTNYTSAQFVGTPPYAGTANTAGTTPPVILSVTENGQNVGGVQATLTLSGAGSASGLTATTVAGTGASYSSLDVTQPSSSSPDTLSLSLPVVGTDTLTAGPVNLTEATPIIPFIEDIQADGGAWQNVSSLTVNYGDTVNLGPQPVSGGTWSWSGPGVSGSTSREIDSISLPSATNVFTATYTNSAGNNSTQAFTITVAPSTILPYLSVNNGAWQTTNSITVNYGSSVSLGPQAHHVSGGSWSWSGPGVSGSTSREIDNVSLPSGTNTFIATYTNPAGVQSTETFTITIAPTTINPYTEVNNGAWQTTNSATVNYGSTVNLGPQVGISGGSWSWSGPGVSGSTSREIDNVSLPSGTNTFIATYTNPVGVQSTETFIITIAPTTISPYTEVNNGAWQTTNSATVNYGSTVSLGPQVGISGGSWSWSGAGVSGSTSREVDNISLPSGTNTFIATYTNPVGVQSTETFTITIAPTTISPYTEVNNGAWQTTNSATVNYGSTVSLGPQVGISGGMWSWSGPGVSGSTSREIDNVSLPSGTNTFIATYTNPAGVQSTETFIITIAPTTINPYTEVNTGAWQTTNSATVNYGSTVSLGPQVGISGGSWSWSGPGVSGSTSREIDNVSLPSGTNTFIATYTNPVGVQSTETFTITIAPTTINPYTEVDNGPWQVTNTATLGSTDTVNLGPQVGISGGSWSWSGPGVSGSTSREVDNVSLSSGTNTFIATYTNPAGVQSTETFTITVN